MELWMMINLIQASGKANGSIETVDLISLLGLQAMIQAVIKVINRQVTATDQIVIEIFNHINQLAKRINQLAKRLSQLAGKIIQLAKRINQFAREISQLDSHNDSHIIHIELRVIIVDLSIIVQV